MIKPSHLLRAAVLGTVFTAMFTVGASAATLGAGTVTADALRLRDTPAAEGEILATASGGTSVVVLEDTGNGWYKVNFNTVEGYMSSEYLTVSTTADAALGYGLVDTDGSSLNMRAAQVPTTTPWPPFPAVLFWNWRAWITAGIKLHILERPVT